MQVNADALEGGFARPVFDAQETFRVIMDAMAHPARVLRAPPRVAPPAPLQPLAGAIACALIDGDTPVWLDSALSGSEAVHSWLVFHTNGRFAGKPTDAAFALVGAPASMPPLDHFKQGSQEYPDRSATLVLQIESFVGGASLTFRGPGIKSMASIAPLGLPADFADQWRENTRRFPRGIDLILIADAAVACLPRSVRLIEGEG